MELETERTNQSKLEIVVERTSKLKKLFKK